MGIFSWLKATFKNKKKSEYHYSDFYQDKDKAVQEFLHYSLDHKNAANVLLSIKGSISYYDSACYLYHHAFEILLKAMHLFYFESFKKTHDLRKLEKRLKNILDFHAQESKVIGLVNSFQYYKYPIDWGLKGEDAHQKHMDCFIGEIGDEQLIECEKLFDKIWEILLSNSQLKIIIQKINPVNKGGRVLMRKKVP